jgi:uncharacterized protein DUF3995
MAARSDGESRGVHLAALLLIGALVAGPLGTHVYWMLGGTWGLYTNGVHDDVVSTGTRIVSAVVVVLLVAAVLVVLAHVGLWKQQWVSDRMIQVFAWALAAFFLLETLAAFTWSRGEWGVRAGLAANCSAGARRCRFRRVAAPRSSAPHAALALEKGRESMNLKETPQRDMALLAIAVVLMLGGALTLVGGWLAAGIAIPLIAIGTALVVIAWRDVQHQHAGHVPTSQR